MPYHKITASPSKFASLVAFGAILCPFRCRDHGTQVKNVADRTPWRRAFRVALLTPGSVSDADWNAVAFDGLQIDEALPGPARATARITRAQEEIQSGAIRVQAATGG
jgi:hypothetical protein